MIFLILGRGKTGNIVADVAHERGHGVRVIGEEENRNASALTPPLLAQVTQSSTSPRPKPSFPTSAPASPAVPASWSAQRAGTPA